LEVFKERLDNEMAIPQQLQREFFSDTGEITG